MLGGIIGRIDSPSIASIMNCYNTGTINGDTPAGGICGWNSGELKATNCYNTGVVTSGMNAGGICGGSSSNSIVPSTEIINCYNLGNVTGGNGPAGGILANDDSSKDEIKIINCCNAGRVAASGPAGGIVGATFGTTTISNCYNTKDVTANDAVGGILGTGLHSNPALMSYCYNSGDVAATGSAPAGGIAGYAATITNSHNTGKITGNNATYAGEIIGSGAVGTDCTYIKKASNANGNGATGVDNMTNTMSMSNFVNLMNAYVTENNSDHTKTQLKTWTLKDGLPVF